ncbi:hypothetical protein HDZ31DRAFT_64884 [Schizophyllum fasciatum]
MSGMLVFGMTKIEVGSRIVDVVWRCLGLPSQRINTPTPLSGLPRDALRRWQAGPSASKGPPLETRIYSFIGLSDMPPVGFVQYASVVLPQEDPESDDADSRGNSMPQTPHTGQPGGPGDSAGYPRTEPAARSAGARQAPAAHDTIPSRPGPPTAPRAVRIQRAWLYKISAPVYDFAAPLGAQALPRELALTEPPLGVRGGGAGAQLVVQAEEGGAAAAVDVAPLRGVALTVGGVVALAHGALLQVRARTRRRRIDAFGEQTWLGGFEIGDGGALVMRLVRRQ